MEPRQTHGGKVLHFTDLEVWLLARRMTREVYPLTRRAPMSQDFAMVGQVRKSVISVSSNIAKGFEREGRRELMQFLSISKGSRGELESQLILAADQEYISPEELSALRNLFRRTSAMINSLSNHLRRSQYRGR